MFRSAANVNIYFLNDYFNAISFNGVSSYLILTIKYYRSIFIFFPMCTFLLEFMYSVHVDRQAAPVTRDRAIAIVPILICFATRSSNYLHFFRFSELCHGSTTIHH